MQRLGSVCRGLPQMSGFAATAVDSPSWAEEALLALLRMQLPSSSNPSSGFCVLRRLDASSKVALEVAFQLSVGVAMVAVAAVVQRLRRGGHAACGSQCCWTCQRDREARSGRGHELLTVRSDSNIQGDAVVVAAGHNNSAGELDARSLQAPLLSARRTSSATGDVVAAGRCNSVSELDGRSLQAPMSSVRRTSSVTGDVVASGRNNSVGELDGRPLQVPLLASGVGGDDASELSLRQGAHDVAGTSGNQSRTASARWPIGLSSTLRSRFIAAGVNFGLTVHATLTVAVVKLLHCVAVPGDSAGMRLLVHASVRCAYGGWQAPLLLVLVLLLLAPAAVIAGAVWAAGQGVQVADTPRLGVSRARSPSLRSRADPDDRHGTAFVLVPMSG